MNSYRLLAFTALVFHPAPFLCILFIFNMGNSLQSCFLLHNVSHPSGLGPICPTLFEWQFDGGTWLFLHSSVYQQYVFFVEDRVSSSGTKYGLRWGSCVGLTPHSRCCVPPEGIKPASPTQPTALDELWQCLLPVAKMRGQENSAVQDFHLELFLPDFLGHYFVLLLPLLNIGC